MGKPGESGCLGAEGELSRTGPMICECGMTSVNTGRHVCSREEKYVRLKELR